MDVTAFNSMSDAAALTQLLACCHSQRWAVHMLAKRPFADFAAMLESAQNCWSDAEEADLLEAFSGHAKIGDVEKLRNKYSRANAEQGQVLDADEAVLQELLRLNAAYQDRHGFIFIVCASGKSAAEMLELLRQRLPRSRAEELRTAAAEQAKITAIRLHALFAASSADN